MCTVCIVKCKPCCKHVINVVEEFKAWKFKNVHKFVYGEKLKYTKVDKK
jgi:hypothetical protein